MPISRKDIQHIANLARLALSPEEEERFENQLSSILEYVSQLQEVDTVQGEYQYQVEGLKNSMDQDEVRVCDEDTRQGILAAFPERAGDLLKVKGVFHE
ncbi:Asp-tRNA(Asn)/Glu-tRNA(Gln) amidotransferase subunit GatC [Candidatus Uhrbacteria bacterium]|nr:Asp-tRNA(Asn)/Glu-tRNA(Gln) amidotransferase subunit GatC [Candidatus Uhrbacteria bacterium]